MDDKKLHELFRQTAPGALERTPSCPDEHDVASYVDATIEPAARGNLERHLADCERCLLLVGAVARLETDATDGASDVTLERARRLVPASAHRWAVYVPHLAAAAVLVLAVGILFNVLQKPPAQSESDYRATRGTTARPDLQITSPSAGAGVDANDLVVRWTEMPGARYYLVLIVTDSGALVTEQRVTDAEWRPGTGVRLEPGEDYYVRVEAYPAVGPSTGSIHIPFSVRDSR